MAQIIPVTNDAYQTFETIIGSQSVRINLSYVEDVLGDSSDGWYVDLELLSDTPEIIIEGERLVSEQPVGAHLVNDFSGAIFAIPTTSPKRDLTGKSPWGTDHELIYLTQSEISDIQSAES